MKNAHYSHALLLSGYLLSIDFIIPIKYLLNFSKIRSCPHLNSSELLDTSTIASFQMPE